MNRRLSGRWRGLRGRVTLAFGAVALGLAIVMGVSVLLGVSRYLLVQRQETTLAQTMANALRPERGLAAGAVPVPELLTGLPRAIGSMSLLHYGGEWFTTSLLGGQNSFPMRSCAASWPGSRRGSASR